MAYFPVFVEITGREILVVGGGHVAQRRVESLLPFHPSVTVVSPRMTARLEALADQGRIRAERRGWEEYAEHEGSTCFPWMVLAATDKKAVNRLAAAWGRERGALVNTADDRAESDFYFPGLVKDGETVVAVTSGGGDHRLAARLTGWIRTHLAEAISGHGGP